MACSRISSGVKPHAYKAPMIEPILVPETILTEIFNSFSAISMPTPTKPMGNPGPRATPMDSAFFNSSARDENVNLVKLFVDRFIFPSGL